MHADGEALNEGETSRCKSLSLICTQELGICIGPNTLQGAHDRSLCVYIQLIEEASLYGIYLQIRRRCHVV